MFFSKDASEIDSTPSKNLPPSADLPDRCPGSPLSKGTHLTLEDNKHP